MSSSQSFGPDAAVREGDLAILARNDPVITDRHSEDVRGEELSEAEPSPAACELTTQSRCQTAGLTK